jgi:hypothetical protein
MGRRDMGALGGVLGMQLQSVHQQNAGIAHVAKGRGQLQGQGAVIKRTWVPLLHLRHLLIVPNCSIVVLQLVVRLQAGPAQDQSCKVGSEVSMGSTAL